MEIRKCLLAAAAVLVSCVASPVKAAPQKEFLTDKEITKIQDAQEIEKRVRIYLEAAALRLKTAEERLNGTESQEGDPLEFFTVEDMLDGYFRIIRAVMLNLDEASNKPGTDPAKLTKALKDLKNTAENSTKQLEALKKTAEDKRLEKVWNLVSQAIDISNGAREGATMSLAGRPTEPVKGKPKKPGEN
jgi:hypothetical protein